ncbi:hypothetical protein CCHL11_04472 [Colletotrichum chlorophyti]|uniref:CFEM domain-containing protein n=1 Tax=Colletotrichum chlorophyti TaxID=708187 RepID=A0A1Q8S4A3_9PEZI|nr:hypothetical protein CCHL11_04472 [Colletotrichum chlorophyti]
MRNLLWWSFLMLPWAAGTVLAQQNTTGSLSSSLEIISKIPQCGFPCVRDAFRSSTCSLDSIAPCVCTNVTLLERMSSCVQSSCVWQDQLKVSYLSDDLCRLYPRDSRDEEIKMVVVVLAVFTFPIVALRLLSRWIIASRLELDDWMTLATALKAADLGFGLHYWNVNPENAQRILKMYYAVQMLYIIVLILAKVSIIALYARIFPDRKFQLLNKLVLVFLLGHGVIFLFIIMFECTPIAGVWDRNLDRKCVNVNAVAMASAVLSIVEDVVILAMPIQQLSQLKLSRKKKLAVGFMLSLGSFACIASIVRLRWIVRFAESYDTTWDNVDVVTWSVTELSCALMCGSLPALRPLFKKIPEYVTTIRGGTRATADTKGTVAERSSSHLSFGDKGLMVPPQPPTPIAPDYPRPESAVIKIHIEEEMDPRMKPLPPTPLEPGIFQPPWSPWRESGSPPATPLSIRSVRREANADYELDLRNVVNTKTWM